MQDSHIRSHNSSGNISIKSRGPQYAFCSYQTVVRISPVYLSVLPTEKPFRTESSVDKESLYHPIPFQVEEKLAQSLQLQFRDLVSYQLKVFVSPHFRKSSGLLGKMIGSHTLIVIIWLHLNMLLIPPANEWKIHKSQVFPWKVLEHEEITCLATIESTFRD